MIHRAPFFLGLLATTLTASARETGEPPVLPEPYRRLLPLHEKLPPPQPGEWLAVHPEPGQTFDEYVRSKPVKPDSQRRVIYVQPLGEFSRTQRQIIELTAKYMEIYFGLPVKTLEDLPLRIVPRKARRTHPTWGDEQILTTYVLEEVLYPRLPKDAVAMIAFTASDLWPGEGWNFVFGQASLRQRVGVWSIYRNGDPEASGESFRLCLRRTLRTATHETAHMLSMAHCILYRCNLCGSNHRAEADRHPLWLCPQCLAKLCRATGADPVLRYERLADFFAENGFQAERDFCDRSLDVLRGKPR